MQIKGMCGSFLSAREKKIIVFPINTNLLVQCFVGFQDRVDIDLAVLEVQDLSDEIIFFRQFVVFYHLKELKIHSCLSCFNLFSIDCRIKMYIVIVKLALQIFVLKL